MTTTATPSCSPSRANDDDDENGKNGADGDEKRGHWKTSNTMPLVLRPSGAVLHFNCRVYHFCLDIVFLLLSLSLSFFYTNEDDGAKPPDDDQAAETTKTECEG
jgi:hypothetical protein